VRASAWKPRVRTLRGTTLGPLPQARLGTRTRTRFGPRCRHISSRGPNQQSNQPNHLRSSLGPSPFTFTSAHHPFFSLSFSCRFGFQPLLFPFFRYIDTSVIDLFFPSSLPIAIVSLHPSRSLRIPPTVLQSRTDVHPYLIFTSSSAATTHKANLPTACLVLVLCIVVSVM